MSTTDSERKEEFRRYLEKSQVTDTITKSLVELYELDPRPKDGMAWFLEAMKRNAPKESKGSAK
eukprot:CAMPEP_0198320876 /NCGR_PEP_ID=MMETSP1450-20131203/9694_1 /TAXON_ID=753684 ORGANISM="Madagascaria erythrocladiodes, Strain CCMP3234" /NCGR_SAMPLE_ID=MMETSP1450 /ASSEMBLY_ACC=CAM_ASM_001115 /LENGTH=63 /DNA_ID=CAMNT_0044024377 /DNA_START=65 /DNA_END=256 /DNA_ORIENTATION=-